MPTVSQLRSQILDTYSSNSKPVTGKNLTDLNAIGTFQTLKNWLSSYSGSDNKVSAFETLLLNRVDNELKESIGANQKLNEALKQAFPGVSSSIINYGAYWSYYGLIDKNPNISTNALVEQMKKDTNLATFADKNGWVGTRSEADPNGLKAFTNYVFSEYAKKNGGTANANTIVNDITENDGRISLSDWAKWYFDAGFSIATKAQSQDVSSAIDDALSPVASSTPPATTPPANPALPGVPSGGPLTLTLDQVKQYYEASGLDKVGTDKFPPPEESLRTLNLALALGANSADPKSIKTLDDVYKYLMGQGESIRVAGVGTDVGNDTPTLATPSAPYNRQSAYDIYKSITGNTMPNDGNSQIWADSIIKVLNSNPSSGKPYSLSEARGYVLGMLEGGGQDADGDGVIATVPKLGMSSADILNEYKSKVIAKFQEYSGDYPSLTDDGSLQKAIEQVYGSTTLTQAQSYANAFVAHVGTLAKDDASLNDVTADLYTTVGINNNLSNTVSDSGSGSDGGPTDAPAGGTGSSPSTVPGSTIQPDEPEAPKFRLIRGKGPNLGSDVLMGNGAAVYIVNAAGERFHVTEALANEMRANHSWYEPEILEQSAVDAMGLRYSLNSVSQLDGINNVSASGFMFIRGDGAGRSAGEGLEGNGNAVFAVNNKGEKFHVSEQAANDMIANNTWIAPVVVTQGSVDNMHMGGTFGTGSAVSSGVPTPDGMSPQHMALVSSLFRQYVGRDANNDDYRIHTKALSEGKTAETLESELSASSEAQGYRTRLIRETFRQFVGREADAEDLRIHSEALASGTVTPGQFRGSIANAPEAITHQNEVLGGVSSGAQAMYTEAINKIFNEQVGRDASAEDVRLHSAALADGSINLDQLNVQIGASQESLTFKGSSSAPLAPVLDPNAPISPAVASTGTPSTTSTSTSSMTSGSSGMRTEGPMSVESTPTASETVSPDMQYDKNGTGHDMNIYSEQRKKEIREHLWAGGTWEDIKTVEAIYDSGDPARIQAWEQFSQTGAYAPGGAVDAGASANQSPFELVQGWGPNLGNSQLRGNGAAVYALMPDGTKLHVTEDMANQLRGAGTWREPRRMDQWELDNIPTPGTLASVGGSVGALEVPIDAPAAPTPAVAVAPPPVPVAPAPAATLIDPLPDAAGEVREGSGMSPADRASAAQHFANGGTWAQLEQVANIYRSGDPAQIDGWERFTKTGKYSEATPWGQTYQKAMSEGHTHENSYAWATGMHGEQASTPVPMAIPPAQTNTGILGM